MSALAGVEGLEPPTPGFGDRCSNQIELHSYPSDFSEDVGIGIR
jgi:hypothetical protein